MYALDDRSSTTYSPGTLVYGNSEGDDPFQILVEAANIELLSNRTGSSYQLQLQVDYFLACVTQSLLAFF